VGGIFVVEVGRGVSLELVLSELEYIPGPEKEAFCLSCLMGTRMPFLIIVVQGSLGVPIPLVESEV